MAKKPQSKSVREVLFSWLHADQYLAKTSPIAQHHLLRDHAFLASSWLRPVIKSAARKFKAVAQIPNRSPYLVLDSSHGIVITQMGEIHES